MLSMKSLLSRLLKHYKIESIGYKSVEEFEFVYHGAIELKDGYKIKISERWIPIIKKNIYVMLLEVVGNQRVK